MKGIKITKKNANNIRKNLIKENQIHRDYKIKSDDNYVYIPLIENYNEKLIKSLIDNYTITIDDYNFIPYKHRAKNFMEYLDNKIPQNELEDIRKSFDIIGDIVILEIPPELENEKKSLVKQYLILLKEKVCIIRRVKFKE